MAELLDRDRVTGAVVTPLPLPVGPGSDYIGVNHGTGYRLLGNVGRGRFGGIMSFDDRVSRLQTFVKWAGKHLEGDERGEAQIFLDRLFQGFGWPGLKEAGATCELRVKKDDGGTSFADLVWKPVVVIEMKKRGTDLSRHYRQAFDYWMRLVPGRPRYAVLCNFDEFWVYDFETQMDTPVERRKLSELPEHYGALAFLFPGDEEPIFGNHHEPVTRQAADQLAECFNLLLRRKVERAKAQKFILQSMMAFFSQNIGLLEKYSVTRLLNECKNPSDSYDLLGGLFEAMNTPGGVHGGRFKGVGYFNGGLFSEPARIELEAEELKLLRQAADADWGKVRPEIFGTLFEHSLGKEKRHAYGAHFTSPADIMKIVGPTIVEPWREAIDSADTLKELRSLLNKIENFKVLDPACGSGNFLYISYRELKRLEARIYERMANEYKSVDAAQRPFGFLTARNFYGMDVNTFAIDIAKVTMMLAHKLAIDELHINENPLPLDNLDGNFKVCDALVQENGTPTPWPKVDAIIGNPPFLGAKRIKPERGVDYVKKVRKAYPAVPGMADYCVYWFRRAHDELAECTISNRLSGRAGLVGTQNIRNNASRIGGLDHVVSTGTIIEAVDNQPWSGEANVNVSIVNWVKSSSAGVVPKHRRLWSLIPKKKKNSKRNSSKHKRYELELRDVHFINSSLSNKTDVSSANALSCNEKPQKVFQGVTPGHMGFVLTATEKHALVKKDQSSEKVIFPYLIGREVVSGDGSPRRYIIDFGTKDLISAKKFDAAFKRIEETVLEDIETRANEEDANESARKQHLDKWWQHWRHRSDMKAAIGKLSGRYIAGSRTQRWPFVFCFMDADVLPGDKMQVFAFDDDYSFGVIQGAPHLLWYRAKAARLKNEEDYNYSAESVFDTYPWPQQPTTNEVLAVAAAGREIRRIRADVLPSIRGGLRGIYHTLELPGKNALRDAHEALDKAVMEAYGFSAKKDTLQQLLNLNREVGTRLSSKLPVTPPGAPKNFPKPARLITDDCLGRPAKG